ncbi:type II toxin-antitoxin system VapC family toxin [Pyrofollis japonicus]|uniref:PIN domain-containing protein n=1 Tax=Pyrofollis japonicus TaxID=3060460 RepID=UPI00295AB118|nr:PIN domain-containing protein [Pyrofollis japonicus]BEP17891.1 type II toxin-antitoxin system VapC family toxin [Pyrofollis japonicus]
MIFLDTNAILYYLHDVKLYSRQIEDIITDENKLYTSIRIIDEAIFTLIRTKAWLKLGIRRIEKLREYIQKHGYKPFKEELNELTTFLEDTDITVLEDRANVQELISTAKEYHLLPADALIALTCKHYEINTILTFDEDFKRVLWLKVVP